MLPYSAGEQKAARPEIGKPEKEINSEIQAIIRQITACVTFLPLFNQACKLASVVYSIFCIPLLIYRYIIGTFNVLVYTDLDAQVPTTWGDSHPHLIQNAEQVRLRNFSTGHHKVEALVAYSYEPSEI